MRRDRKLVELLELGFIHPGAHDLAFHGFAFRRRQARAAEYVRIDSHTLTEALMQLTAAQEVRIVMAGGCKSII